MTSSCNSWLPSRRRLFLNGVVLSEIENTTFAGFLHAISLINCGMTRIDKDTFTQLRGVQLITVKYNQVHHLDANAFSGLNNLYFINLAINLLTTLPVGVFNNLRDVQYLLLYGNHITSIEPAQFSQMANLKYIDLSYNFLVNVSDYAFEPNIYEFPLLRVIYLSDNHLTDFPIWLLHSPYLRRIYLNNNRISFQGISSVFGRLPSPSYINKADPVTAIKIIEFQNNAFTEFDIEQSDDDTISKFHDLITYFRLDFGTTFHCNCRMHYLYNYLRYFRGLDVETLHQSTIDYNTNGFHCFEPVELRGLPLIEVPVKNLGCYKDVQDCPHACRCWVRVVDEFVKVDCSNQSLVQLPEKVPDDSIELDFSNNKLVDLTWDLPSYLSVISVLNLSGNNLRYVDDSLLAGRYNLSDIYLDNNELTTLPRGVSTVESRF